MQKALSLSVSIGLALSLTACDKKSKASTSSPEKASAEPAAAAQAAADHKDAPAGDGFAPESDPTQLPMLACSGGEPDWSFELTPGGKLSWAPMQGDEAQLDVASTQAPQENSWNITPTSTTVLKAVVVSKEACSDTMSDTKFTYKAVVTNAQGDTLMGCCNPMQ